MSISNHDYRCIRESYDILFGFNQCNLLTGLFVLRWHSLLSPSKFNLYFNKKITFQLITTRNSWGIEQVKAISSKTIQWKRISYENGSISLFEHRKSIQECHKCERCVCALTNILSVSTKIDVVIVTVARTRPVYFYSIR